MGWRDFLYFSRYDRRSVVALAFIAVAAVGVTLIVEAGKNKGKSTNTIATDSSAQVRPSAESNAESGNPIALHEFDPNTVDSLTLISFGLQPHQVRTFLRYRRTGAVFRTPESLSRVYTFTDEDIDRLLPYVRIGETYANRHDSHSHRAKSKTGSKEFQPNDTEGTVTPGHKRPYPEKFSQPVKVDPNTADTTLLRRIPGIGTWISRNIVSYRERLGGYHSVSQLHEVKHFSPELAEWFEVDPATAVTRKININTASFQQLRSHPYISYAQVKKLLEYIRLYGKFENLEALSRTQIFTEEELNRLLPYITF